MSDKEVSFDRWLFFPAARPRRPVEILLSARLLGQLNSAEPSAWVGLISYVEDDLADS